MDNLVALVIVTFLIFIGISGMRMGRHMTVLFNELKSQDNELWRDLAQPNTGNIFDTAGYLRGNQILFKGNNQLATHPMLSEHYQLARKWFLRFQVSGAVFFILLTILLITKNTL